MWRSKFQLVLLHQPVRRNPSGRAPAARPDHPIFKVLRPSKAQVLGGLLLLAIVLTLLLFRYGRLLR
ncbi:MAG: hypothetical protein M1423_01275 [Acidobacteria bacterium]|nr:hypothetical protein [Acidobacteriota bacterium]